MNILVVPKKSMALTVNDVTLSKGKKITVLEGLDLLVWPREDKIM